jgi:hypothetical protein
MWRKRKSLRSDLSGYQTVSRRRNDLLRDSIKVVDLQLFARSESEDGSIRPSQRRTPHPAATALSVTCLSERYPSRSRSFPTATAVMPNTRPMSPSRVVHPALGVLPRKSHPIAVWQRGPSSIERRPPLVRGSNAHKRIRLCFCNHGRCGHDYSPLAPLVSYAPIQHGLSHSRNRAVSEGNYTRNSSRHCGYRPYYGALGADSPVTISSLQPMQIAGL